MVWSKLRVTSSFGLFSMHFHGNAWAFMQCRPWEEKTKMVLLSLYQRAWQHFFWSAVWDKSKHPQHLVYFHSTQASNSPPKVDLFHHVEFVNTHTTNKKGERASIPSSLVHISAGLRASRGGMSFHETTVISLEGEQLWGRPQYVYDDHALPKLPTTTTAKTAPTFYFGVSPSSPLLGMHVLACNKRHTERARRHLASLSSSLRTAP